MIRSWLVVVIAVVLMLCKASSGQAIPECSDCDEYDYDILCTPPFENEDFSWMDQWYLDATRACEVWPLGDGFTGKGIIVGVCDFGILETHPDLENQIEPTAPNGCSEERPNPAPPSTQEDIHGTWMAGIIAAEAYKDTKMCGNIAGIAFGATLAEIFIFDNGVSQAILADAVTDNNDCGIHVKATSWDITTTATYKYMEDVLASALFDSATSADARGGLGTLQVLAAGNDGAPGQARCDYDEFVSSRFDCCGRGYPEPRAAGW
ncbi:MAG: S8 family serine peptidase [Planctomycetota bacterium]|nr:S8 family serine peptidase [Planctomycetota bacterium]